MSIVEDASSIQCVRHTDLISCIPRLAGLITTVFTVAEETTCLVAVPDMLPVATTTCVEDIKAVTTMVV